MPKKVRRYRYDVFLSHNGKDKPWVREFCKLLRDSGLRVFFDEDSIEIGKEIAAEIERGIEQSRRVFLVLSPAAISSHWVALETALAIYADPDASRGTLVPIMLEWVPPEELRPAVRRLNWVDLTDTGSRQEKVRHLIGRGKSSAPKPGRIGLRRLLLYLVLVAAVLIAGFAVWHREWADSTARDRFLGSIPWRTWVIYDPTEYDPYGNRFPSEASIRADLRVLRRYAFDGVITASCQGTLKHIPRIAHEEGLAPVIVGVWDLRNAEEVAAALDAAEGFDAYCIGHGGLTRRYSFGELEMMVARFR